MGGGFEGSRASTRSVILIHQEPDRGPLGYILLVDHLSAELIEYEVEQQSTRVWHHHAQVDQSAKQRPVHNRLVFFLIRVLLLQEV